MVSSVRLVYLPDGQARQGVRNSHWEWAAKLVNDLKPDIIVNGGDLYDMPSLSSWDKGKRRAENARYQRDIDAGNEVVDLFESTLKGRRTYDKHFLIGNHEQRIERFVDATPALEGKLGYDDFNLEDHDWQVHDFLHPVKLNGVYFSHFFPKTAKGTVTPTSARMGAASAAIQIKANMRSCVAGHRQGFEYAEHPAGKIIYQSVIAGSFYQHDEHYMGPHGNDYWRGLLVLNFRSSRDPWFDLERWSIWRLKEKYGK